MSASYRRANKRAKECLRAEIHRLYQRVEEREEARVLARGEWFQKSHRCQCEGCTGYTSSVAILRRVRAELIAELLSAPGATDEA